MISAAIWQSPLTPLCSFDRERKRVVLFRRVKNDGSLLSLSQGEQRCLLSLARPIVSGWCMAFFCASVISIHLSLRIAQFCSITILSGINREYIMQHFQATKIPVLNKYDNKINYLKRKSELSVRRVSTQIVRIVFKILIVIIINNNILKIQAYNRDASAPERHGPPPLSLSFSLSLWVCVWASVCTCARLRVSICVCACE